MNKHTKRQKRASIIASMIIMTSGLTACSNLNTKDDDIIKENNRIIENEKLNLINSMSLEELRQYNMELENLKYGDTHYLTANEQELLQVSKRLSELTKDYFKSHGAGYFSNRDTQQFWPEDIEYIVTAMAFRESSYRTNYINELNCGGLTGMNKTWLLPTLEGWLHNTEIWGENYPNVNCNPNEVDIFNPVTCLEYTYYDIGYLLANRFVKDKMFLDEDGQYRSVWDKLEYSEDTQIRLVVACNLFGIGNVVDAVFNRQKDDAQIKDYIYGDYVNDVMNKAKELKNEYNNQYLN